MLAGIVKPRNNEPEGSEAVSQRNGIMRQLLIGTILASIGVIAHSTSAPAQYSKEILVAAECECDARAVSGVDDKSLCTPVHRHSVEIGRTAITGIGTAGGTSTTTRLFLAMFTRTSRLIRTSAVIHMPTVTGRTIWMPEQDHLGHMSHRRFMCRPRSLASVRRRCGGLWGLMPCSP